MLRVQLILAVLVVASLLAVWPLTPAGGQGESAAHKRQPCGKHNVQRHRHSVVAHRQFAREVWAARRWRDTRPIARPWQSARLRHYRVCARRPVAANRRRMKRNQRWTREAFGGHRRERRAAERRRQEIAALTPYDCGANGSYAIPCYIVDCESGYSWSAYNPSGAAAAYQLMAMHGRPWPVRSEADKLEHHRIASRLWAGGSGASHWSQCL